MTTAAIGGRHATLTDARPVRRAPGRLKISGGGGRVHWWHARVTGGLTITGAMLGALYGVLSSFLDGGLEPQSMLEAYGATAGLGASLGLVLGLVLGLLAGLVDRYVLPQRLRPHRVWVQHRPG